MLIKVLDPVFQTIIFSAIFIALLLASARKKQDGAFFSKEVTTEVKGLAILAIIFSHMGYFLSYDTRFLYPLSVLAGVGVNLFLFLSGFGLTISSQKSPLSILSFYKKRLANLFIPLWIVIILFLAADFFILKKTYTFSEITQSFLGFFREANLFQSLNSPLWYFSLILFYYLIFPLTFFKKIPFISPILILLLSLVVLNLPLPVNHSVLNLYKLHILAFPLGVLFGQIIPKMNPLSNLKVGVSGSWPFWKRSSPGLKSWSIPAWPINFKPNQSLNFIVLVISILVFLYTSINSGVGEDPKIEQSISLITTFSILLIFSLSKIDLKLFSLFGIYSYELYLLHWPIVSRLNLFLVLPPFLMVILNLILFIFLGYILQKIVKFPWESKLGGIIIRVNQSSQSHFKTLHNKSLGRK